MRKKQIVSLLCTSLLLLSGCSKAETVPNEEVVQAYDTMVSLSDVHKTSHNVAVQYANYMRNGYYDAAFDLVHVAEGVYYTKDDMLQVDTLREMNSKYILTDVTASNTAVILTYREKIGEAYTIEKKDKPSVYLGEVCTSEKVEVVPVTEYNGAFYVDVNSDYMSTEQIALKVPDNCDVWFGNVLLDNTKRDDNGYYILSEYLATGYKDVKLSSAVEDRNIVLLLDETETELPVQHDIVVVKANEELYNGIKTYEYTWDVSRETQNSAVDFTKSALQTLFDDTLSKTDFYESVTYKTLAACGNAEHIKPEYLKLCTAYSESNSKLYTDLICVNVELTDTETMKRKGYTNSMLDKNTMRLHVNVEYSYIVYSKLIDSTTPKTGTVNGYVYLTKENGEWKLCDIDERLLKNVR